MSVIKSLRKSPGMSVLRFSRKEYLPDVPQNPFNFRNRTMKANPKSIVSSTTQHPWRHGSVNDTARCH
jgi:hypothetical protein